VPREEMREDYHPETGFAPHAEACRSKALCGVRNKGLSDGIDLVREFQFRESGLAKCWCTTGPPNNELICGRNVWMNTKQEPIVDLNRECRFAQCIASRMSARCSIKNTNTKNNVGV
jgi:hypothetical protein